MKSHELKQDRATVLTRLNQLSEKMKGEKRTKMTKDEVIEFDRMMDEKQNLDKSIKLAETIEAEDRSKVSEQLDKKGSKKGDKVREIEARTALNTYLRKGKTELNAEQRGLLFNPKNGILTETRTQLAGTANVGAELVREEYVNIFEQTLKYYGGMFEAAQVLRTATGGPMPIPTSDDTSNVGAILGEGSADSVTDIQTAEVVYNAYKYTSKAIKVSQELIQDDSYNLVGHIPEIAGIRIGRITNTHFTTGDASSKPQGVTVGASNSSVTFTADTITRAKILEFIYSLDAAYRKMPTTALMFNSRTERLIAALTVGSSDDRPLWVPAMTDGVPSTIEGFRYIVNEDMPDADTSTNRFMVFGDWSKYIIRQVQDMIIRRTDDRHIEEFNVGFYAFARYDGKVLNSSALKYAAVA